MRRKKSNKNHIFLSFVALLVICFVASGITYSWIEGGTTLRMATAGKTINTASDIETVRTGTIKLSPNYTGSQALGEFDAVTDADNLYFSPASSADGKNFFLPAGNDDEGNVIYRTATTNDVGTKFVKYDFNFSIDKKCFVYLSDVPKFTVLRNNVEQTDIDTSAFRFLLSDGTTTQIFSTLDGTDSQTVEAVTNESGATTDISVKPASQFINLTKAKDALFSYEKDKSGTMTVAIWLDSNADKDLLDALSGCKVSINFGLELGEEKYTVNFNAVTVSNENVSTVSFDGGKITYNDTDKTAAFSTQCVAGEDVSATATAYETADGWYDFKGWYTDAECTDTNKVSTDTTFTDTPDKDGITYYAKFVERNKFDVNVIVVTDPDTETGGTATAGGKSTYNGYTGESVTLTATKYDGYRFAGWYTNEACTGSDAIASETYSVTIGDTNATYYAKFIKQVKVSVTSGTGGTGTIDGETVSSKTVDYNTPVTLGGTADTGYTFNGIFNSNGSKLTSTTVNITSDVTYTAKFTINSYSVTFVAKKDGAESTDGGTVSLSKTSVEHGSTVDLTATPESGYKLEGIYKSDGTPVSYTASGSSYVATVTITEATDFYANFVIDATKTTIYFEPREGYSSYYAWIWDANNNYTGNNWPGQAATYDSETGYYKYVFETSNTGTFNVIVSNNGASQSGEPSATIGGTYLFTSGDNLIEFNPSNMKTVYIGVISYITNANEDTLRLHWWNSSCNGNATAKALGKTYSCALGNDYWSNETQTFTMYEVKVPVDAVSMKAWTDSDSNIWYGDNSTISDGNCLLIFNYNGDKSKQITYNPLGM